jgi:hypothetical membrane protein
MKTTHAKEVAVVSNAPPKTQTLAVAGIVGPALFTAGVLAQQLYRRDSYDPILQTVSDLTAGPYGWVQQVNFVVFGLLVIAFAVGLRLGVRPTRAGSIGPEIVGLNGVGLVVAGIFPLRQDADGLIYDPIGVHIVNGAIFFLGIGIVLVAVSPRLRSDPRWRGLATYTLVTGIALLAAWVVLVALARPVGAPLHDWFGLAQRLALLVWLTCIVVLALRLRRVAGATRRRRGKDQAPTSSTPTTRA